MCEIEWWSAAGAWLAALVALAIGVADKVDAWLRRRAERVLLFALVLPDLRNARFYLGRLSSGIEKRPDSALHVSLVNELLASDEAERKRLNSIAKNIDLPSLREAIGRLHIFSPDVARGLATVIDRVGHVQRGFETLEHGDSGDSEEWALFLHELRDVVDQSSSALADVMPKLEACAK